MDISGDALIFPEFFLAANRLFLLPSKLDSLLFRKDVERERERETVLERVTRNGEGEKSAGVIIITCCSLCSVSA
jgi:hypothetical protein